MGRGGEIGRGSEGSGKGREGLGKGKGSGSPDFPLVQLAKSTKMCPASVRPMVVEHLNFNTK